MVTKYYHGFRHNGHTVVMVEFHDEDGNITRSYPLCHFHKHSQSAFDWGEHNPGATDLARAIMIDYLAYADDPAGLMPIGRLETLADGYYADFKNEIVAGLPKEEWKMKESLIAAWLQTKEVETLNLK